MADDAIPPRGPAAGEAPSEAGQGSASLGSAPVTVEPAPLERQRPKMLLPVIVACGLFMENLDSSVLATSLPAIARSLNESPIALKLAITSYLLALAVFLPASGWLADRFGARNIFRLAIVLFATGSILCGLSHSIGELVAARILQGIGGSMMVPVGRLIVLRSVPRNELVGALAWLTIPAMIGPIVGPLVGGFITTYFDWRWIFWVNIPIAVAGLILVSLYVPDIRGEQRVAFDRFGFALMAFGIAAFVSGSTALGVGVLPTWEVAIMLAIGAGLIALYASYGKRRANPIIDFGLFGINTFRTSVLGGFLFRCAVGASTFLLPLLLQFGFGFTPFQSGAVTFVSALGALGLKTMSTQLLRRFGFRQLLLLNSFLVAALLSAPALFIYGVPLPVIYALLFAGGFARSLHFTSMTILSYSDIPQAKMSQATSLSSVFQQIATSMGISFAALLLQSQVGPGGDILGEDFTLPFLSLAVLTLISSIRFYALPKNAGEEVSGHKPRAVSE